VCISLLYLGLCLLCPSSTALRVLSAVLYLMFSPVIFLLSGGGMAAAWMWVIQRYARSLIWFTLILG